MQGKRFKVWYKIGEKWEHKIVEVLLIPPDWKLMPKLARAVAYTALGVTDGVIVESDDEVMYQLHPGSETKLDRDHFWREEKG